MKRKPATRVFQHFSFRRHDHAEPIRRSVVTRPKVKRAEPRKMRFVEIRDCVQAKGLRAASSGFNPLGLIRG